MQSDKEVARGLFVACRDTSIMLAGIEEPLDEISLGIGCEVAGPSDLAVCGFGSADFKAVDEAVGIISPVAEKGFGSLSRRSAVRLM